MQGQVKAGALDERLITGYTGGLFLTMSIGWIGINVGRQILPPLLPTIMVDLSISPFQAGAALTLLWAMYALLHYPGGRLADQLSRKTVLIGALATLSVGFILLSGASSYLFFLFSVTIVGTGAGLYFISMRATTADLYVEKRAQAFGIQRSIGNIGGAAAAGVAVIILAVANWRSAFIPLTLAFIIIAILLHFRNRESYVVKRIDLGIFETGHRIFENRSAFGVMVTFVLVVFTWQGLIGFLPTFLHVEKNFSTGLASTGYAVFFIIGVLVGPLAGVVADRHEKPPVAVGAIVISVVGLMLLIITESTIGIGLSLIVLSIGMWAFPDVMQAHLVDALADETMAGDLGAIKTIYAGLGSLGPSYVGFVAGLWGYTVAYIGMIGFLFFALLVVIWISLINP